MNMIFIGRITVAVSSRSVNRKKKYSKNKIQRIQPLDFPLECGKLITHSVSTRYNKDSPTSIGGEMNCKQENERQWRAERNRYPPLT